MAWLPELEQASIDSVEALRLQLQRGGVAVLLLPLAGDIQHARQASRDWSARCLGALGGSGLLPNLGRSATPGLAGLALCAAHPVGIDVERIRPDLIDDALLELALHATERSALARGDADAFFGHWTRKEAVLKALGVGLAVPPATLCTGGVSAAWTMVPTPCGQAGVVSIDAPPGFAAALSVAGLSVQDAWRSGSAAAASVRNIGRALLESLAAQP